MVQTLLYGGTFDPIHNGHLVTCHSAVQLTGARRLIFIPARLSPHKQGEPPRASGRQRFEMIALAISGMDEFQVDDRELSRDGPSYTIDTVRSIKSEHPGEEFMLLLGEDQLPKFPTWHKVAELRQEVSIAVMGRPGALQSDQEDLGILRLATPLVDVSSTEIRKRVAQAKPIDAMVPRAVAQYILEHHLYR